MSDFLLAPVLTVLFSCRAVTEALVIRVLYVAVLVLFLDFSALIALGTGIHVLGIPLARREAKRPFFVAVLVLQGQAHGIRVTAVTGFVLLAGLARLAVQWRCILAFTRGFVTDLAERAFVVVGAPLVHALIVHTDLAGILAVYIDFASGFTLVRH